MTTDQIDAYNACRAKLLLAEQRAKFFEQQNIGLREQLEQRERMIDALQAKIAELKGQQ